MKNYIFSILFIFTGIQISIAQSLILMNYQDQAQLSSFASNPNLKVHYVSDNFIIATAFINLKMDFNLLDSEPWQKDFRYFIARFNQGIESDYISNISTKGDILFGNENLLILKIPSAVNIDPPNDGSLAKIENIKYKLPVKISAYSFATKTADQDIVSMIENVDTNLYLQNLQHLQDYGTRNAYSAQGVQAQNWIRTQFENLGYSTQLFDFSMPSGPASDDVLATKTGSLYPEEYVLLGGHYDSYSYSGNAPGADDDGTGTCGVLEAARVMAGYDFDRTIIFCCWSGEEYGLYGSSAYAAWAESQGMNILGYFNIDMCGYRYPGEPIHSDMIAPSSAQPLVDFYESVCSLYLPDFLIEPGSLSGGDSDHTSFNNHGYMGIFPFEDSQHYSPYIHTSNDLIGTSVNSLEMAMKFTQASIASVASLANWLAPPSNLVAVPGINQIELSWLPLLGIDYYNIYKNNGSEPIATTTEYTYTDTDVINFETYTYYVTAVYTETGEESSPSIPVMITLLPRISFPFTDDFETGADYWDFTSSWGLTTSDYHSATHSMTESPSGNYTNNLNIATTLYTFSLAYTSEASLSFWIKYALETNYDYLYLEISIDGSTWSNMATFNGTQSTWTQKSYSLNSYLGQSEITLRFRFYSDVSITYDGVYIDDFNIDKETNLDLKVFLEGPFYGSTMNNDLNTQGIIPLSQPYNVSPWNYNGGESVGSIPNNNIIDWVLVEIRDASNPALANVNTITEYAAAFVLNNGSILGLDGSSSLTLHEQVSKNMFVIIHHRNHLSVLSAGSPGVSGSNYQYDFSSDFGQAYGGLSAQKELSTGIYGLIEGDGNADGMIDSSDKTSVWSIIAGKRGYEAGDYNMDGQINNRDKNDGWFDNVGNSSQIPD